MKTLQLGLVSIAAAALALPVFSQVSITDFSTASGLQLNGNAAVSGSVLRLTPSLTWQSGSAFSTSKVPLSSNASFSTYFQFRITESGGIGDGDGVGADGIVFTIQNVANNVGTFGGGIGYQGIPSSFGVEFDTYDNGSGWGDPNGNHVNFNYGGVFSPSGAQPVANRFNNGSVWNAWVDFNGTSQSLELRLAENSNARPLAALLTATVDLASILGDTEAFIGFTAGTGLAYNNHDILAWEFRSSYNPIDPTGPVNTAVPEPSTYGVIAAGLLGIVAVYRRRQRAKN